MKVVLLAGGFGTRFAEQSEYKPKPMIEIGGMPILWHIMKEYSYYGYNEFVICAGYKQHVIKEWFADYFLHTSDITFDFANDNKMIVHNKRVEFRREHGKLATLTAVTMKQDKGVLDIVGNTVQSFREKNAVDGAPINAGYMVFEPAVFDYIDGDSTVLEKEPLERLASEGQLMSYMHEGFWQCMDTQREQILLNKYLETGHAPWKKWED